MFILLSSKDQVMNEIQTIRNMMAEHGMEFTINEMKDIVHIAKKLQKLATQKDLDIEFLKNHNKILYDAVMKIKYSLEQ